MPEQQKTNNLDKVNGVIFSSPFIPFCVFLAISLRLFAVLIFAEPISDAGWFYERAVSIASGNGYSIDGVPTSYWPVGYPGFLGIIFKLFGSHLATGLFVNLFLSILTMWIIYKFGKEFFSELHARIALLLFAVYADFIAYTGLLFSEVFFQFIFFSGVLIIVKAKKAREFFISGLIFGVACLTKPQILLLPAIMTIFTLSKITAGVLLKRWMLVYVGLFIIVLPWGVRNYQKMGSFFLFSTNGGINLYIGNNPHSNGTYTVEGFEIFDGLSEIEKDRTARELAKLYIIENPIKTVLGVPAKLWYMYSRENDAFWYYEGGRILALLKIISQSVYMLVMTGFLISISRISSKKFNKIRILSFTVIVYFTFISMAFFGMARYKFPFMPLIFLFFADNFTSARKQALPKTIL